MRATGNNKIHTYRLSIHSNADGFSVYVYRGEESSHCECQRVSPAPGEPLHLALEAALGRERLVGLEYDTVEMVLDTPTTRVPLEQFQREEVEMICRLTFPHIHPRSHRVCYEILPHLEVVEVFAVDSELLSTVARHFPEVQLHTLQGRILEAQAQEDIRNTSPQRRLHVAQLPSGFFVYILSRRRLLFACTYPSGQAPDALYYILQVWKRLDLDVRADVCVLHDCPQLAGQLGRFVKTVSQ